MATYTRQSVIGRALMAIGSAGSEGLTASQLEERVGNRNTVSMVVGLGLAERTITTAGDVVRLTTAGKAARPLRNPAADKVTPPPAFTISNPMKSEAA